MSLLLPANVFTVGSNADPPQPFALTQASDRATRESKFEELWNSAPGLPPPTNIQRARSFKAFIDGRIIRMWEWINWARPRITFLTAALTNAQQQLQQLQDMESASDRPPSRPITSTSAVEARDQFVIDNEEQGRNVINAISRIPADLAREICEQHKNRFEGQHQCWISGNAGKGAIITRISLQ